MIRFEIKILDSIDYNCHHPYPPSCFSKIPLTKTRGTEQSISLLNNHKWEERAGNSDTDKMCGINLGVWKDESCEFCQRVFSHRRESQDDTETSDLEFHHENLRRRGPDAYGKVSSITHPGYFRIECAASVLQMRAELRKQPVSFVPTWKNANDTEQAEFEDGESDDETAYLCWNGEIYQQTQPPLSQIECNNVNLEEAFAYDVADTDIIANQLRGPIVVDDDDGSVSDSIRSIDSRRISAQHHQIAGVMSRLYNAEFAFCILTKHGVFFGRDFWGRRSLLRWDCPHCGSFQIVSVAERSSSSMTSQSEPTPADGSTTSDNNTSSIEWKEVPPGMVHCILFSDLTEKVPEVVYPKVPFPRAQLPVDFQIPAIPQQAGSSESPTEFISDRLWSASLELEHLLRRAVTMRLDQSAQRRSTGVLFSGGVDSVVLAALAADILASQHRAEKSESSSAPSQQPYVPVPILYLYNVSFGTDPEKSADRRAALESLKALQAKHNPTEEDECDVKIVFRDIVVEWEGICQSESHVRTLISPKSTVMDVNIAIALWYASGGRTVSIETKSDTIDEGFTDEERSPRVLLLGMGADELMGGYGRHRKAYERGGWEDLKSELTMDQDRLWERNCGRDDRLCSDHGREARFPFLDAHVVRLLQETMANEDGIVCDFHLSPGVGDKRILRLVAKRLGMDHASGLVKRAIQFGSRISHVSDKRRFGSRWKAKGAAKI